MRACDNPNERLDSPVCCIHTKKPLSCVPSEHESAVHGRDKPVLECTCPRMADSTWPEAGLEERGRGHSKMGLFTTTTAPPSD